MTTSPFRRRGSKRWRYYVSQAALRGDKSRAGSVVRVSAAVLEALVGVRIRLRQSSRKRKSILPPRSTSALRRSCIAALRTSLLPRRLRNSTTFSPMTKRGSRGALTAFLRAGATHQVSLVPLGAFCAIPVRRWESHCPTKAFKIRAFRVICGACTNKIYQQSLKHTGSERD
jgi:hypothetical protein